MSNSESQLSVVALIAAAFFSGVQREARGQDTPTISVDFTLSQQRMAHGDVAFLQATIKNQGEKDVLWHQFRPSDIIRMQVSSGHQLVGPPLVVGEYVDPLSIAVWPSLLIEPGGQCDAIVMIRLTLGPRAETQYPEAFATVHCRGNYGQANPGVTGLVSGHVMRLGTAGEIHATSRLLVSSRGPLFTPEIVLPSGRSLPTLIV